VTRNVLCRLVLAQPNCDPLFCHKGNLWWKYTFLPVATIVVLQFRGLQTILSEGHMSYHTAVRGPDILRNVIVSVHVTFYQISKLFVNMLFFHYWQNIFAGRSLETLCYIINIWS